MDDFDGEESDFEDGEADLGDFGVEEGADLDELDELDDMDELHFGELRDLQYCESVTWRPPRRPERPGQSTFDGPSPPR